MSCGYISNTLCFQRVERAGNLYDAVMLYALTADSMIKQGLDFRNGRAFIKHATTIVFEGIILHNNIFGNIN